MNLTKGLISARSFSIAVIGIYFVTIPNAFPMAKKPPQASVTQEIIASEPKPTYTLRDCYELALKRSETIAIRKEAIEETEAEFLKAGGEIFGDIDFVVTDFRQDAPRQPIFTSSSTSSDVGRSSTAYDRRERKFVISQPLFQGFKSIAALGAAGSLRKQRKQERIRAEQLLFFDVARAFYDVIEQKRNVEIIEEIRKSFQERIADLTEREKIGRSRPSEVASAVSRMRILESELAHAKGLYAISVHVIEFLTGVTVDFEQIREEDLPAAQDRTMTFFLGSADRRPDVEAAHQATKTAWRGVIEAQSDLWPEITLENNTYVKREGFQKDINWDLLFKINIPLSRGGENVGVLKQAISQWKTEKLNYSLAKRQAVLEIKEAFQNWQASVQESNALQEAVSASDHNFDLQKEEYARNLVSNLDVLEALEELYNTERQANQTYYQMKENFWRLKVAAADLYESV